MNNPTESIQFLPESRRRIEIDKPGENKLLYWALGFLALVLLIWGGLKVWEYQLAKQITDPATGLDKQIEDQDKLRDRTYEEQSLLLSQKLNLVGGLIDNHIIWSNALRRLQNLTPAQIQLVNLGAKVYENKMQIEGLAADYGTIARQIKSYLSEAGIVDVLVQQIKLMPTGRLQYQMFITIDKNKFLLAKPVKPWIFVN